MSEKRESSRLFLELGQVIKLVAPSNSAINDPFLKAPFLSLISEILSNMSMGGRGNLAFPGPKRPPFPQFIKSS